MNREYIGHPDQCMTVQQGVLTGGKQQGVRFVNISNGSGLDLIVLPDRCMDLYQVRFKNKNCGFIYPCGIVHPSYFIRSDEGWIDTFAAGFLTTCGLSYTGIGADDDGIKTSLHGVIGNMPAVHMNIEREIADNVQIVRLSGEIHEHLSGANITLKRDITVSHKTNEIAIHDQVQNSGFKRTPHMIIYHCNLGYPLLSESAVIEVNSGAIRGRTRWAQENVGKWREIPGPQNEFEEMCFYHEIIPDADGLASAALKNPREHIGVEIRYNPCTLDNFVQWSMFKKGEYVLGLEPCNATIDGRDDARRNNTLKYLDPGENVTHNLVFRFFEVKV